jgi:hypothetical protein
LTPAVATRSRDDVDAQVCFAGEIGVVLAAEIEVAVVVAAQLHVEGMAAKIRLDIEGRRNVQTTVADHVGGPREYVGIVEVTGFDRGQEPELASPHA